MNHLHIIAKKCVGIKEKLKIQVFFIYFYELNFKKKHDTIGTREESEMKIYLFICRNI